MSCIQRESSPQIETWWLRKISKPISWKATIATSLSRSNKEEIWRMQDPDKAFAHTRAKARTSLKWPSSKSTKWLRQRRVSKRRRVETKTKKIGLKTCPCFGVNQQVVRKNKVKTKKVKRTTATRPTKRTINDAKQHHPTIAREVLAKLCPAKPRH